MPPKASNPYGSLDIDEYKDFFLKRQQQWDNFISLSTIHTSLPQLDRPEYTATMLLSCLSKSTLKTVLTMGLAPAELKDAYIVIQKLQERCNAGSNRHVWRQQFATRLQRKSEQLIVGLESCVI